jgi:hypothetical protein
MTPMEQNGCRLPGPLGKADNIRIVTSRWRGWKSGHVTNCMTVSSMMMFLCLVGGAWTSGQAQGDAKAGVSNSCYTEDVVARRGTSFPVGVFVDNSDTLVGMQVPIYYKSDDVDLICDSVSFAGSRCRGFSVQFFKIDPREKIVFFAMLNTGLSPEMPATLPPGKGRVATLWFTVAENSGAGDVVLRSGPDVRFPHERINYGYLFWNPSAVQVECRYDAGNIALK